MTIKTHTLTLKESYDISPSVRHFVFNSPNEISENFIPGQFITMHLPMEDKILRRSYSIANKADTSVGLIEFAAGYVNKGPASETLFSLKVGDAIEANGPFGRLVLKEEEVERYILIATSTGITPYRAMLDILLEKLKINPKLEVHILQGVRAREDLLYQKDFINFAKQHSNAHFHACYSREQAPQLESFEFKGYVQDKLKELIPNPIADIVYLCGNPSMVDACYSQLTEQDFQVKQIRREKYISR